MTRAVSMRRVTASTKRVVRIPLRPSVASSEACSVIFTVNTKFAIHFDSDYFHIEFPPNFPKKV